VLINQPKINPLLIILNLILLLILLFEGFIFFINRQSKTKIEDSQKYSYSSVTEWTATTDLQSKYPKKDSLYDSKQNDNLVREKVVLDSIITPNKTYSVKLLSGTVITISITDTTYTGKAQFNFGPDGAILSVNYVIVPKDYLSYLQVGQTVSIGYYQKDFSLTQETPLTEFVIF
jgi:hypothetical protein